MAQLSASKVRLIRCLSSEIRAGRGIRTIWRSRFQLERAPAALNGDRIRLIVPSLVQFRAMTNLTSVLSQLEQERSRLAAQLDRLNHALVALGTSTNSGNRKGRLSAAARARIAAAQRARWAKARGGKVVPINRPKRKMSAAAIAKIRAAQKARWAKWRRQQKTA